MVAKAIRTFLLVDAASSASARPSNTCTHTEREMCIRLCVTHVCQVSQLTCCRLLIMTYLLVGKWKRLAMYRSANTPALPLGSALAVFIA